MMISNYYTNNYDLLTVPIKHLVNTFIKDDVQFCIYIGSNINLYYEYYEHPSIKNDDSLLKQLRKHK